MRKNMSAEMRVSCYAPPAVHTFPQSTKLKSPDNSKPGEVEGEQRTETLQATHATH